MRKTPPASFTILEVHRLILIAVLLISPVALALTQERPKGEAQPSTQEQIPPVKVNVLNVCSPSDEEKEEILAMLVHVPQQPRFISDFEVSRGLSNLQDAESARYVRLRREFPPDSRLSTVQYSISNNGKNITETLVLSGRDVREMRQISIETGVSSAVTSPDAFLSVDTPVSRIKVERFGKSSVALARCAGADQRKYEPVFAAASSLLTHYRKRLDLRTMMRSELAWLAGSGPGRNPRAQVPSRR